MPFERGDRRHKGRKLSVEHRRKIIEALYGIRQHGRIFNKVWKTENELKILIPKTPSCICGYGDYLFKPETGYVIAICKNCWHKYYFYPELNKWGSR